MRGLAGGGGDLGIFGISPPPRPSFLSLVCCAVLYFPVLFSLHIFIVVFIKKVHKNKV